MKIHKFLGGETQYSRRSLNFLLTNKISIKMSYTITFTHKGQNFEKTGPRLADLLAYVEKLSTIKNPVTKLHFKKIEVAKTATA